MEQQNSNPDHLYKIVSPEEWQESQFQKYLVISSFDEKFIHMSTKNQIPHVLKQFWSNKNHVILKLASKQLIGDLVFETNPGGTTQYYHLYNGKIPLSAVIDVSLHRVGEIIGKQGDR